MWIMLNLSLDRENESKRRKAEIEYGGFFANPEVYQHVKKSERDDGDDDMMEGSSETPFRIVKDSSEFTRRLNLAAAGTPDIPEPDLEIAEKVRRFREANPDLPIYQDLGKPRNEDQYMGDELIIERDDG